MEYAALALCVALTCTAVFVALSYRARIEKLEETRATFLNEMNSLVEQCDEILGRADAKRKRAEMAERRVTPKEDPAAPPLPFDRNAAKAALRAQFGRPGV